MLTIFVVASSDDAEAVLASPGSGTPWPIFEAHGLDNAVIAALWAAIDPSIDISPLEGTEYIVNNGGSEGPWLFNLPAELVQTLAELPGETLTYVAKGWAKQPELAYGEFQAEDLIPSIEELSAIAKQAVQSKQALFLWMAM